MNLIKCEKGHCFDADKNLNCPICNKNNNNQFEKTYEKHIEPTPCGGAYSISYYYDKNEKACSKELAHYITVCEFDEKDNLLQETFLVCRQNKKQSFNETSGEYCHKCGKRLSPDSKYCTYCGSSNESEERTNCPLFLSDCSCGKSHYQFDNYCVYCGDCLVKNSLEGQIIDRKYRLLKQIDESSYYKEFLGVNEKLNQSCKIQAFKKDITGALPISGIITTAKLLKSLDHPNIPQVVDVIDWYRHLFIVMDYVDGQTLQSILDEFGPQREQTVIGWAKQIAEILIYLSYQNPPVIHRNIKPKNLILSLNGIIKLMDFSIARQYVYGATVDKCTLGTAGFAAPEQFGGAQTDCRTDIYGLGMTMYCLLTGRNPAERSFVKIPIREINPNLSKDIEYIIEKCTRSNPAQRYQSPFELKQDLINISKFPPKKSFFDRLFNRSKNKAYPRNKIDYSPDSDDIKTIYASPDIMRDVPCVYASPDITRDKNDE